MSTMSNLKFARLQSLRDQIMSPKNVPTTDSVPPAAQRKRVDPTKTEPEPEVVPPSTADDSGVVKKKRKGKNQDKPAEAPADVEPPLTSQAAPEVASKSADADDAETLKDSDGDVLFVEPGTAVVEVPAPAGNGDDSDHDYRRRSSSMPSRPEQCGAWYSLQDLKQWSLRTKCGRIPAKDCACVNFDLPSHVICIQNFTFMWHSICTQTLSTCKSSFSISAPCNPHTPRIVVAMRRWTRRQREAANQAHQGWAREVWTSEVWTG
jgi:hypothetical protein